MRRTPRRMRASATQHASATTVQNRTQPIYGASAMPTATASAIPAYGTSERMWGIYTMGAVAP